MLLTGLNLNYIRFHKERKAEIRLYDLSHFKVSYPYAHPFRRSCSCHPVWVHKFLRVSLSDFVASNVQFLPWSLWAVFHRLPLATTFGSSGKLWVGEKSNRFSSFSQLKHCGGLWQGLATALRNNTVSITNFFLTRLYFDLCSENSAHKKQQNFIKWQVWEI